MSVNYATALKSTRMQAVIAAIDANGQAKIEIGTAGMTATFVTIDLETPSFTESGGVITMAGVPLSGAATAAGKAAGARIKDGAGNIIVSDLTVGTAGSDINLAGISIALGQTVTLSSGSITHA